MKSEIVLKEGKVYHLGIPPGVLAPNLILVGDPQRAFKVAQYFDQIDHEFSNREYLTLGGYYQGHRVTVIGTGIGTDNVEIAIIEAYGLLCLNLENEVAPHTPAQIDLIRVGTSGGIHPSLPTGSLVISSYAIGLDNTGLYYDLPASDPKLLKIESAVQVALDSQMTDQMRFKGKIFPYASKASEKLCRELQDQANKHNALAQMGITASTPGFYGPSGRFIKGLNNSFPDMKEILSEVQVNDLEILNMEMESSLIFHLCSHLGIEAATICPAISAPSTDTELIDYDQYIDLSIRIALDTLVKA